MFRIAAFARLAGVSAKVLRDYDEAGLFRPAWVDRQTGYRLYTPAQLPALRRIVGLRELGVRLPEIRGLIVEGADLAGVLERRHAELETARREAEQRLAALGISIAGAGKGASPDVVVRNVTPELVATLDAATTDGDVGRAFYELEKVIRDRGVRASRPPGSLVRESADAPEVEIFVPVRRAAPSLEVRRLPAIRAATILHHGAYEKIAATRAVLDEWIERAGLAPAEPVRIVYLQFGAEADLRLPRDYLVEQARDLLTEIQVPLG
jgi:DNA-binding transcriptional MerR regulator